MATPVLRWELMKPLGPGAVVGHRRRASRTCSRGPIDRAAPPGSWRAVEPGCGPIPHDAVDREAPGGGFARCGVGCPGRAGGAGRRPARACQSSTSERLETAPPLGRPRVDPHGARARAVWPVGGGPYRRGRTEQFAPRGRAAAGLVLIGRLGPRAARRRGASHPTVPRFHVERSASGRGCVSALRHDLGEPRVRRHEVHRGEGMVFVPRRHTVTSSACVVRRRPRGLERRCPWSDGSVGRCASQRCEEAAEGLPGRAIALGSRRRCAVCRAKRWLAGDGAAMRSTWNVDACAVAARSAALASIDRVLVGGSPPPIGLRSWEGSRREIRSLVAGYAALQLASRTSARLGFADASHWGRAARVHLLAAPRSSAGARRPACVYRQPVSPERCGVGRSWWCPALAASPHCPNGWSLR